MAEPVNPLPETTANSQQVVVSTETHRGATIYTSYATRQVKAYPVFETEIDSFNLFNTLTLAAFTSAASLVSLALGIWTSAAFSETLTVEGRIATKFIAPALCVAALVAVGLGIWARQVRATTWQQIKRESSSVTAASPPANGTNA